MTLDNLPEQLQKNLEAAGLADLTVDQCEIIRRFLAGERTLVSGHDGAGKLTALVIGFAAKALASRRSLETGRLPEGLLITNHPDMPGWPAYNIRRQYVRIRDRGLGPQS